MRAAGLLPAGVALAILAGAAPVQAQQPRLRVTVEEVAGEEFYLDAGSAAGLGKADTVAVAPDSVGDPVGSARVLSVSTAHARLGYVGRPFPVTRGQALWIEPRGGRAGAPPPEKRPTARAGAPTGRGDLDRLAPVSDRVHGRVTLELDGITSTTKWGGAAGLEEERTTLVPATRLRLRTDPLAGGIRLRTSLRAAHRSDDRDAIDPATSIDVYEASLSKAFEAWPLELVLGRFYGRTGPSGGSWDGLLARFGGEGTAAGVALGLLPDDWTRGPSGRAPRGAVFLEHERRGEWGRWSGALAVHHVRPDAPLEDVTFVEGSQSFARGRARLHGDAIVDRDPDGSWRLSRLRFDGSAPVSERVAVRGRFSRQMPHPLRLDPPGEALDERHDGLGAGLTYRGEAVAVSVDVSGSRVEDGDASGAATTRLRFMRLGLGPWGVTARTTWWWRGDDHGLSISPGLTGRLGAARVRAGYGYDRTDDLGRDLRTDALEADVYWPLTGRWTASGRLRRQWGAQLDRTSFRMGIGTTF